MPEHFAYPHFAVFLCFVATSCGSAEWALWSSAFARSIGSGLRLTELARQSRPEKMVLGLFHRVWEDIGRLIGAYRGLACMADWKRFEHFG